MKKPFLTLFSFVVVCTIQAQQNLNSDLLMYRNGDKLIKQQVEYQSPNPSGNGIEWNFSKLKILNENYTILYEYLNDSVIQGTEHRTIYNYLLRNDSLLLLGFENPTSRITYQNPELLLNFPLLRGKQTSDYFYGEGEYCEHLGLISKGSSRSEVDADGSLILPTGDTLTCVTRIHIQKRIIENLLPLTAMKPDSLFAYCPDSIELRLQTDSAIIQLDTWRWYAEGYRYPVFEVVESMVLKNGKIFPHFKTAFYYAPIDQYYDLDHDTKNQLVRDANDQKKDSIQWNTPPDMSGNKKDNYRILLDPDKNNLIVDYNLTTTASVSLVLFDLQGRRLSGTKKTSLTQGYYQEIIPLNNYPKGQYLLQISVGNRVYGEKVIK